MFDAKTFISNFIDNYILKEHGVDIEIEARIGHITSSITGNRIKYDTLHPVVFTRLPLFIQFNSNIGEEHYKYFKAKIGKLTNDSVEITDTIFIGNNYRKIVSTDGKAIFQKKIRRTNLDIYFPNSLFDIRISVSTETNIQMPPSSFIEKIIRERKRTQYMMENCTFDFTQVKDNMGNKTSYEVEIELTKTDVTGTEFFNKIHLLLNKQN